MTDHTCPNCAPGYDCERGIYTLRDDQPSPAHDESCESEFISGPMVWTPCRCDGRAGGGHTSAVDQP